MYSHPCFRLYRIVHVHVPLFVCLIPVCIYPDGLKLVRVTPISKGKYFRAGGGGGNTYR